MTKIKNSIDEALITYTIWASKCIYLSFLVSRDGEPGYSDEITESRILFDSRMSYWYFPKLPLKNGQDKGENIRTRTQICDEI